MIVEYIENINEVKQFRAGMDLVEFEQDTNPMDGFVLLGFNEIGQFCREPQYAWIGGAQ